VNAARSTARRMINSTLAGARPGTWSRTQGDGHASAGQVGDARRARRQNRRRTAWCVPSTSEMTSPTRTLYAMAGMGDLAVGKLRARLAALRGDLKQEPKATQHRVRHGLETLQHDLAELPTRSGSLPATGWIRPTTATTTSPPARAARRPGSPRGRPLRNSSSNPRPRSAAPGRRGPQPARAGPRRTSPPSRRPPPGRRPRRRSTTDAPTLPSQSRAVAHCTTRHDAPKGDLMTTAREITHMGAACIGENDTVATAA
jgi:hypothetical protein